MAHCAVVLLTDGWQTPAVSRQETLISPNWQHNAVNKPNPVAVDDSIRFILAELS